MIEKTFVDRVPTHPGRVTLTPVPGQANVYDMVRSDSPTEPGTPLNKATFDSMTQSRLTGRYYKPAVTRSLTSRVSGLTVNPIPTTGWPNDNFYKSQSGQYEVEANSAYSSSTSVYRAFDGDSNTSWTTNETTAAWIQIKLPAAIVLKKIKFAATRSATSGTLAAVLAGSTDGVKWTELLAVNQLRNDTSDIALTNTGEYSYYRWTLNNTAPVTFRVYSWQFSEYDTVIYNNGFTIADRMPTTWDAGQRVMAELPANASTVAVTSNTFNGVAVNTILQPGKRYELRYTGSAFVAKEV